MPLYSLYKSGQKMHGTPFSFSLHCLVTYVLPLEHINNHIPGYSYTTTAVSQNIASFAYYIHDQNF